MAAGPVGDVVLDASAVNYTPLMLGDYDGAVVREAGGGYVSLASPAKAIIGKSRWLLRTLVASAGCAWSHAEAEAWPGIDVIHGGRKAVKGLGLVQLAYGSTSPAWRALYSVRARLALEPNPRDEVYLKGESKITRYSLITMNKSRVDLKSKAPIAPGRARLEVKVVRRPLGDAVPTGPRGPLDLDALDKLVAGLTLATLRLLGLGAGANRGFGRFAIEKAEGPGAGELASLLQSLDGAFDAGDAKDKLRDALSRLQRLVLESTRFRRCEARGRGFCRLGILDLVNIRVYKLNQSVVGKLDVIYKSLPKQKQASLLDLRGVHLALEVIALATLKASWKNLNKEGRSGGAGYHTWILGLPRRQKIAKVKYPCIKRIIEGPRESGRGEGRKLDVPSGYLFRASGAPEAWRRSVLRLARIGEEHEVEVSGEPVYAPAESGESFVDGRRQSPFIMFPLNRDGSLVAVVPLYPEDLEEVLDFMVHAGGLVDPTSSGGPPRFTDMARIVGVVKVAGSGAARTEVECDDKLFVNDAVFGVARPNRKTHPGWRLPADKVGRQDLLEEAYRAALEFIDRLLS